MKVSEIMRIDVVSARPGMKVADVASQMVRSHISGMPVTDDSGKVVGMITEGDLLRRAETHTERHRPRWLQVLLGPGRLAEEYVKSHARKVEDVM
ncbi:MAG: CBS domain-containing protein, partial [Rhodospirillaceae bacterium]